MISRIHRPGCAFGPVRVGNTGCCSGLVTYLSKEENTRESSNGFFTNARDWIPASEAENLIDGNRKGLKAGEDKFYMLTLNPSEAELQSLIFEVTGRPGITDFDLLDREEKQRVYDALKDYTRSCMDRYAWNFNRTGVESGDDLVYFAKVETRRTYKGDDPAVRQGLVRSGEMKPGLQLHVHVCVSRKGRGNGCMLNPFARDCHVGLRRDPALPGRFNRRGWDYQNAQTFQAMYGYTDPLEFEMGEGRGKTSFPCINAAEDKEMQFWLYQMHRKARRMQRWTGMSPRSDLLEAPKKAFRAGRFMLAFIRNPTHALFGKVFNTLLMGTIQQMNGNI